MISDEKTEQSRPGWSGAHVLRTTAESQAAEKQWASYSLWNESRSPQQSSCRQRRTAAGVEAQLQAFAAQSGVHLRHSGPTKSCVQPSTAASEQQQAMLHESSRSAGSVANSDSSSNCGLDAAASISQATQQPSCRLQGMQMAGLGQTSLEQQQQQGSHIRMGCSSRGVTACECSSRRGSWV